MIIPKVFIKEGVQATKAAREAIANVEKAVKQEVFGAEKLVRTPASDLFEKKAYMETEAFWNEPQNFANYARGQYLTEGGKAFQDTNLCGEKLIEVTNNIERKFGRYQGAGGSRETIDYVEKDLLTGKTRSIRLYNGQPYESFEEGVGFTYYNGKTGAPVYTKSFKDGVSEYRIFAKDGKTVTSKIRDYFGGRFRVKEMAQDGSYTLKSFKNGKQNRIGKVEGDLESIEHYDKNGNLAKAIDLHEGTKSPKEITYYKKDGSYEKSQRFDIDGNLI